MKTNPFMMAAILFSGTLFAQGTNVQVNQTTKANASVRSGDEQVRSSAQVHANADAAVYAGDMGRVTEAAKSKKEKLSRKARRTGESMHEELNGLTQGAGEVQAGANASTRSTLNAPMEAGQENRIDVEKATTVGVERSLDIAAGAGKEMGLSTQALMNNSMQVTQQAVGNTF
ncbi:MAG TPA: hypothetical protein VK907_12155, partial [Phnomibacter sp.]|nr:hypothetical protein [Phnomibacter sp.]